MPEVEINRSNHHVSFHLSHDDQFRAYRTVLRTIAEDVENLGTYNLRATFEDAITARSVCELLTMIAKEGIVNHDDLTDVL